MGKYTAGNPNFIVENMPGAGHRIAANHVYKVARPDGLTIGNFFGGLLVGQVLGYSGIEFDATKFEYIGVPVKDNPVCALNQRKRDNKLREVERRQGPGQAWRDGCGRSHALRNP